MDYVKRQRRCARRLQEVQEKSQEGIDEEPVLVENLNSKTVTNGEMSQSWLQLFRMVLGMPGLEMILIPS